jgi:threonine synthase
VVFRATVITLGQNIKALEVDGMFDDCQDMVKSISGRKFATPQFNRLILSICAFTPNVLLFFAYKALKNKINPWFSLAHLGISNICAGIIAKKMGLPIAFCRFD